MKTYHLQSLGCAKNRVDSEVFAGILEELGYRQCSKNRKVDVFVINACAFLESALAELELAIYAQVQRKLKNKVNQLVITGCVMNRGLEFFQNDYPEVDAWIPLKDFEAFEIFLKAEKPTTRKRIAWEGASHIGYLRISDGCSNHCSYCTIPSIRGELASVPMEDLLQTAQNLISGGAKELIVIAQDTCSYGLDIYGRKALPELLQALLKIPGYDWLRLMYMHPDHFENDWSQLFMDNERLLPYFEIPIQHISGHILASMGRRKMRSELLELLKGIRKQVPKAVFRTTLMTGFPNEGKAEFKELQELLQTFPFLHIGIFAYSPEPGTVAIDMKNQVSPKEKIRRVDELMDTYTHFAEQYYQDWVGKKVDAIIESEGVPNEDGTMLYRGRTWFQAPEDECNIEISGFTHKIGDIITVEITEAIGLDLFGDELV